MLSEVLTTGRDINLLQTLAGSDTSLALTQECTQEEEGRLVEFGGAVSATSF